MVSISYNEEQLEFDRSVWLTFCRLSQLFTSQSAQHHHVADPATMPRLSQLMKI